MTTDAKWFVALFITVMWTAVSVVAWPGIALHLRLRANARETNGEVISVDTHEHNCATYRYTVAGHVYTSSEIASHRRVGAPVRVFYSPENPSESMLQDPSSSLRPELLGLAVLYGFIAAGALFMAARFGRPAKE